jgi:hypothetical protein
MKRPTESDFEINVTGGGVEVIFTPTKSHYFTIGLLTKRTLLVSDQSRQQGYAMQERRGTPAITHPMTLKQWRYVWQRML